MATPHLEVAMVSKTFHMEVMQAEVGVSLTAVLVVAVGIVNHKEAATRTRRFGQ